MLSILSTNGIELVGTLILGPAFLVGEEDFLLGDFAGDDDDVDEAAGDGGAVRGLNGGGTSRPACRSANPIGADSISLH